MSEDDTTTRASYLGDGAYVQHRDGVLRVYTHDGVRTIDEVFLGPEEVDALFAFASRVGFRIRVPQGGR